MTAERKRAVLWMKRHSKKLERVAGDHSQVREHKGRVDRMERLQRLGEWEDHDVVYSEKNRFVPLLAQVQEVSAQSADLSARVRHVLTFVPEAQRALLFAYYIEGVPWTQLRNGGESRQAVHNRLTRARQAFERAWLDHAEDDVQVGEDDF
jgi:DNA-directed RNA polymerase specialized sigma24 family protein